MKKEILISLAILFFSPLQGFAVVQGVEFPETETHASPYVSLDFSIKGLIFDPCSATYLGKGKILTAAHCFLLNEYEVTDPEICIQDAAHQQRKLCIHKADYEVYFPPVSVEGYKAPTRKTHKVIRIPKPDIAVIVLKESLRPQLPKFAVIPLQQEMLSPTDLNEKKFEVIGQGCTNYIIPPGEMPKGVRVFRSAEVLLTPVDSALEVNSIWMDSKPNGGVCWGDSGGALMMRTQESPRLSVQVGVVSAMKTKFDRTTGKPNLVTSVYTRLDQPEVQNWLRNNILVLP